MQEPTRYNLLGVLQKSLRWAQKKTYIHRVIYIGSHTHDPSPNIKENLVFNILIDSNIKLINEEHAEDPLTGFGLFYSGYFINIIEGPEETIIKHLKSLSNTFEQKLKKTPEVTRFKIILISHHINMRYYSNWSGRYATPPVLLDSIEQTSDIEDTFRHIKNCVVKLYRMSEYLRNHPPNMLRSVLDNISELCQSYLPEVNLLDYLFKSSCVKDVKKYTETYGSVPECTRYFDTIWPLPCDFVPLNILGDDGMKTLLSTESEPKGKEGEEEEIPE